MEINSKIFKTYDIRGIYPGEINEEVAYLVGRAFVRLLNCQTIIVGRDMRDSSPSLFEALTKGINDEGADVINLGMVSTPMLDFAIMKWGEKAGIMISASHNPGIYNAFKLLKNGGKGILQLFDEGGINDIKNMVLKNELSEPKEKGRIIKKEINNEYYEHVLSFTSEIKKLKIITDFGNGIGVIAAKKIYEALPIEAINYFEEPDGNFPNHEPNPHEIENLEFLQNKVVEEKADLGIFYDGDADRSLLVDENGKVIYADIFLGVLSLDALKNNPGGKIFYDLRFTKAVAEEIKNAGGEPIMLKVGNPFYKDAIANKGGLAAGEFSGHIMLKEHYGIDDGLFAALKFISIMSKNDKKASELAKTFEKYFHTEEINMKVADADLTLKKVKNKYSDGKLITIDGILINYKNWWLSLRKSNTEPVVRLRIEADTKELLEKKRTEILEIIKN